MTSAGRYRNMFLEHQAWHRPSVGGAGLLVPGVSEAATRGTSQGGAVVRAHPGTTKPVFSTKRSVGNLYDQYHTTPPETFYKSKCRISRREYTSTGQSIGNA
eukprot:3941857-Rhodomonas_salina.1